MNRFSLGRRADSEEMKEIMEAVEMTKLGQMLLNEGISRGMQQGLQQTKLKVEMLKL